MAITVYKLTLGPVRSNCYIVGDSTSRDAVVIDAGDSADLIFNTASEAGWTIREILATHAHFDHVLGVKDLKRLTGAPFRLHAAELPLLHDMPQRARLWVGLDLPPAAEPDVLVAEGDTITVGGMAFEVLHTPGHSLGHVSYVLRSEKLVFCGDVLFRGSVGRTDLPDASHTVLMESIVTKLLPLGDEFGVAPGHGQNTTIGTERLHNPFVVDYLEHRP